MAEEDEWHVQGPELGDFGLTIARNIFLKFSSRDKVI